MINCTFLRIYLACYLLFNITLAEAQTFNSGNTKIQLLELYSSQGCSSCPPAERWVSKQLNHPQLWKQFIPLVFHVDYWDYLGWKDPFSNKQFSQRQRKLYSQGAVRSVYTPGIVFDGEEWRGWYRGKPLPMSSKTTGILRAELSGNNLTVNYSQKKPLQLNVALLGFGLTTQVEGGENMGREFSEDFVVLHHSITFSKNAQWHFNTQTNSAFNANRYALVMWINTEHSLQPIQATGDFIKN